ncbi:P-loop containing nucleoside triphosphate hydrolase protein [Cucurbitaria berberidis CBS 394.84]|uniref:RNA helicase n=1 Tax=Cucurbitaria berberidis CBS 394.84 TaxID=1168544 RepID=A0A9P4L3I1_9PLEO|nr:P-loop containing nucleoside triphosphate hydrolase protein [Cucurbitaria berberidis CBS 394.84]KAF1840951.1 P-loop containing nucleoside triphosphate hydrolase protein [Cucurbitaria berberidis CBS 394.84]
MATRADSSRYDRDRGRYSPPRRARSRSPARRDRSRDRHSDRYGGGRLRDDRERVRDRDRDSHRRDDRRERDSHRRRSRSPPGRRDRSRERTSDRYRRDRDHDDRDRRHRSMSHRPGSRASTTPAPDSRRDRLDSAARDEKKKDPETQAKEKLAERAAKLAEWKKRNAERLAKEKGDTPGSGASPIGTAPSTPTVAAPTPPPASEIKQDSTIAKAKVLQKSATEKVKQKLPEKSTFKLDESAAARPLLTKPAGKPVTTAVSNRAAAQAKANGNIGSFGLKAKSATEAETTKKTLLDDEVDTSKRKFQALPDFTPGDEHEPAVDDVEDDAAMSDIGSDDDETNAQLQAQLEKRRAEIAAENIANEDTTMEEVPAVDESGEKMDVDETAGAEEDDVDPLDAFMADLSEVQPSRRAPTGEAMFNDDIEPEQTSVEAEDLLALRAAKKKKKEVPAVDHEKVEYEPFRKDFYTEPAEVTQMTPEEVADLRHELDGIKVKPDDVPRPVTKWAQMGLLQATMDVFTRVRYERPTSIQSQAIPIAESGRDLIGVAKTGSGKTLAFGIPMIRHVLDQRPLKPSDGPIGLILAPTRELSLQIVNELKPFLSASGITIKCAYGGQPISDQIAMIKRGGIHILCATPGRLIDLLQSNSGRVLNFRRITYVVLDEADRMFDMGFEPQVMKILATVRPDRQTILFSATFPKNMAALARKALNKPAEVIIGGRSKVAPEITQVISLVQPSYEKKVNRTLLHLGQLFAEDENSQVLIFTERQETAEDLLSKLYKAKYFSVNTIHGAKDQTDRNEAINDFKQGVLSILIATSVAARGLDVPGLAMVFNFDCPTHLEDYVHRCGRTGRAGNKGTAITLIENPGQERFAVHVVKALRESGTDVPEDLQLMADTFHEKAKSGAEKYYGGFGGKGLDKLDAARALEKKREKRALKLEGEEESEEETELPAIKKPEVSGPGVAKPAEGTAAEPEEQPSWMKLLNSKIVVSKTERPEASHSGKPMTAREKAEMAAQKVDGRLSKKGMIHAGQPIDNKGPDAGLYHSTIEINDFPQKARWAVTNRTNVAKILESTGVSITTKGTFYPTGKEPSETDLPKLYILVEGDTENVVTQAMMELTRLLREGTIAAEDASAVRGPTGRYSVV